MNTYRHDFSTRCPNNGQVIWYRLEIEALHVVMAEDIQAAGKDAQTLPKPYHENIADMLHERFGGVQRLFAFHHGVEIETLRGALK